MRMACAAHPSRKKKRRPKKTPRPESASCAKPRAKGAEGNWTTSPPIPRNVGFGCGSPIWVPQMACPGKWRHGPKPLVPWWFNFDPYPGSKKGLLGLTDRKKQPTTLMLEAWTCFGPQDGLLSAKETSDLFVDLQSPCHGP